MLKYTKIALFVLIPCFASAQSVSVDPYSFSGWGQLRASTMISAEYKIIGLHAIYVHKIQHSFSSNSITPRYIFGTSIMTPRIKDTIRGGLIYFSSPFPTSADTRLNAFMEFSYQLDRFRIHYRHISNAGIGIENHGIDYIGLSIMLD